MSSVDLAERKQLGNFFQNDAIPIVLCLARYRTSLKSLPIMLISVHSSERKQMGQFFFQMTPYPQCSAWCGHQVQAAAETRDLLVTESQGGGIERHSSPCQSWWSELIWLKDNRWAIFFRMTPYQQCSALCCRQVQAAAETRDLLVTEPQGGGKERHSSPSHSWWSALIWTSKFADLLILRL